MLIYDYALDPYHCAIRLLAICLCQEKRRDSSLSLEKARILDYYLVYPSKLAAVRLPIEHKAMRTAANQAINPYRHSPSKRAAFDRMRPIFYAAASALAAVGYIDSDAFAQGFLKFSNIKFPPELSAAIDRYNKRQSSVGNFVISVLSEIPLNGIDGLKHRTGLLEHRYDID